MEPTIRFFALSLLFTPFRLLGSNMMRDLTLNECSDLLHLRREQSMGGKHAIMLSEAHNALL